MKLFENGFFAVERAAIEDGIKFENAKVVIDEPTAAVIDMGRWLKCVFSDTCDYSRVKEKYGISGDVCLIGAPEGLAEDPCYTYAYLNPMPPVPQSINGMEIKRLAPSLAEVVLSAYHNPGGGYTVERMEEIMRTKGVFGAIVGGKLAGFIGRHRDGNMGMLEVFENYRRRGIAAELEKFLITYVMTFGRVPICDVYADNPASMALQSKLGLTKGVGCTYWISADKE